MDLLRVKECIGNLCSQAVAQPQQFVLEPDDEEMTLIRNINISHVRTHKHRTAQSAMTSNQCEGLTFLIHIYKNKSCC
jgi:hypothetical protein